MQPEHTGIAQTMPQAFKTLLAAVGLSAMLLIPLPVPADDHGDAKRLREAGQIVPLKRIVNRVQREQGGRVLDAELIRRGERYRYEVEVLNRKGEVWELQFDAHTGRLIGREKER